MSNKSYKDTKHHRKYLKKFLSVKLANESDRLWVSLFKLQLALPTAAAIPCISVCTFISSFVTAKIIDFIPGSKWVIG